MSSRRRPRVPFPAWTSWLGAASNDLARRFAPCIREAGAVFVDNSSAFRLCDDVPLVVPEINPQDAGKHNGIIANPNCSTIIALTAVHALNRLSPIEAITGLDLPGGLRRGRGRACGAGAAGARQRGGKPLRAEVFAYQIAFNLIPRSVRPATAATPPRR